MFAMLEERRNPKRNLSNMDYQEQEPRCLGPHIAIEELVPLVTPTAFRALKVEDKTCDASLRPPCISRRWARCGSVSVTRTPN